MAMNHYLRSDNFYGVAVFIFSLLLFFLNGCKSPEGPAGPKGTNGVGYESLTDANTIPKVIFTYPANQNQGPYDYYNQFQIRFNKIMDLESFKKGIIIYSAADTMELDTNSLTTVSGDIIQFSARDILGSPNALPWKIGKSYTLKIPKEISDINGNHLRESFSVTFMPEPYFRVRSISPKNMAMNVSIVPKIKIIFNSAVDTSILSSILISPPIAVQWSFSLSMQTIVSVNDTARFDGDTQYTITILPSAHDTLMNQLSAAFQTRFRTIPFRVSSSSIQNGSVGVPSTFGQLSFYLTAPIDTSSIKNGISVFPPVKLRLWGVNSKSAYKIHFDQLEPFAPSTKYTINLTSSIRSVSGKPLVPFTLEFTTRASP